MTGRDGISARRVRSTAELGEIYATTTRVHFTGGGGGAHERQLPVSTSPVLRPRAERWWAAAPPRHVNNRIRTCRKRAATPPNLPALSGEHRHVQPRAAGGPRRGRRAGAA